MGIPQRGDHRHDREGKCQQGTRHCCQSPEQHPERPQHKDLGLDRREIQSSPNRLDHAFEQTTEYSGVSGVAGLPPVLRVVIGGGLLRHLRPMRSPTNNAIPPTTAIAFQGLSSTYSPPTRARPVRSRSTDFSRLRTARRDSSARSRASEAFSPATPAVARNNSSASLTRDCRSSASLPTLSSLISSLLIIGIHVSPEGKHRSRTSCLCGDYCHCRSRQNAFFFCGDHVHPDRLSRGIEAGLLPPRGIIGRRVYFDSRPAHARKHTLPDRWNVLTDAPAKDDPIAAAQDGKVGPDVLAGPVTVQVHGKLRLRRGVGRQLAQLSGPT